MRGRIFQASALDGFYVVKQVPKKLPNERLRLLSQVGNYLYAVGLLGFVPPIFLVFIEIISHF